MVEPRSREGDGFAGLRVERVDLVPTDLGTVIVRVAGRWRGDPVPALPVLHAGDRRFDALAESSGAAERAAPGPSAFRATFSVPEELRPSLLGPLRLTVGERELTLPAANEIEGQVSGAPGTVVDRAVLAERRARRAELAEEAVAERAEEAESSAATLEAELAKLELRLEQARSQRAELEARLADTTRDARVASQRAHAERRRREEALEEAADRVDEAEHEAARLRARLGAGEERARDLAREVEALRRRVSEAEHVAATAEVVRRRAEDDAKAARPQLGEDRQQTLRAESTLAARATQIRGLPHRPPSTAPVTAPNLLPLLAAEQRAVSARVHETGSADLRQESRRAAAAVAQAGWTLAEARDAVGGAAGGVQAANAARAQAESAREAAEAEARRLREREAALHELVADAGEALAEAELRIGDAQRATTGAQDRLDAERADRERAEAQMRAAFTAEREELQREAEEAAARSHGDREAPFPAATETAAGPRPVWLPVALERLAVASPADAARLCVQLLPAQALGTARAIDYDLRIADVGWHAVTLREGRGTVARLEDHRGRRAADFRLDLDAPALVRLLVGGGSPRLRRAGRFKVRGTLRRRRAARSLPATELDLARLARAEVWPDPGLVLRALAGLIEPEWTEGHAFAVALVVLGPRGSRWRVRAADGAPLEVGAARTAEVADATVRMTQAAFQRMLAGRPAPDDRRTLVSGDVQAVAALVGWIERAQHDAL